MSQCFTSGNYWGYNFQQIFVLVMWNIVKPIPKKGHQSQHTRIPTCSPHDPHSKICQFQFQPISFCNHNKGNQALEFPPRFTHRSSPSSTGPHLHPLQQLQRCPWQSRRQRQLRRDEARLAAPTKGAAAEPEGWPKLDANSWSDYYVSYIILYDTI